MSKINATPEQIVQAIVNGGFGFLDQFEQDEFEAKLRKALSALPTLDDSDNISIDELLSEFKRQGFDTSNWDGEEGAEKAIVDGVVKHISELEPLDEREVLEFLKKLPLPLPSNHKLVIWANQIRGFYGHPVYLVGSQTTGKENPRDVDVVCGIPDSEFTLRYGDINEWLEEGVTGQWTDVRWKWADDCSKRSIDGMECTGF